MPIADVSDRTLAELISLDARVAVVTGSAQGIGAAIAHRLAEAGAHVVVADLDPAAAERTAREIGTNASAAALDVTADDQVVGVLDEVVTQHGSLDILVNNAGIYPTSTILETTSAEWDRVLDVNLRAVFVASREAARRMVDTGCEGVILNIAALAGLATVTGISAHYCVSKAGVVMLTQNLALELGEHGIRVLALAPGLVLTPGITGHRVYRDLDAMISPTVPLGRSAQPDDIARAALFCVSDLAKTLTGDVLRVDSGQLLT